MELSVIRIEVENIRGIQNGILEPGTITILRGDNATGKSSWLDAFRAVFDGGYDSKLVRIGETKARVELTLSDGSTFTRSINAEKHTSTLTAKSKDGEVIKAPQAYLESIADSFAYDPLDFMFADKKTRVKLIQAFLNVSVSPAELREAIQDDWFLEHYDPRRNGLDTIDVLIKAAYERRRKVNVLKDEAAKTVNTLRREIPTLADDCEYLQEEADKVRRTLSSLEGGKRVAVAELNEQYEAEKKAIDLWEKEEIAKIRAEREKRLRIAEEVRSKMRAEIDVQHNPGIKEAEAKETEARQRLEDYHKAQGIRDHLRQQEEKLKDLVGASLAYDRALEALDALKKEKMADLPIDDAEIRDDDLFIGGIAFDGLNTAQQIMGSIQIGASRAKNLPFMVIDGLERLGAQAQKDLFEGARAAGFQIIAAEVVKDEPLKVVQL